MIHTIGDSHSQFGWNKIKNVRINHIGARLMYSFTKNDFNLCDIKKNEKVVFCFGEIDVRCHIKKNSIDDDYMSLIDKLSINYINNILEIKNIHNLNNIYVYNVVPPKKIEFDENEAKHPKYLKYDEELFKPYIMVGSDYERLNYTRYLNSQLKKLTTKNNLGFIDIYNYYADENGFLNLDLSDGWVHIDDELYLKNYLIKELNHEE